MPFTYDASADCCLSAENITSTAFIDVTALLDPRDASPTLNMGTEGILPSNVWCWLSFFARIVVLYKKRLSTERLHSIASLKNFSSLTR